MTERHHARRAIHGRTEVVAVTLLCLACVESHADAQRRLRWPSLGTEQALCVHRCGDRVARPLEGGAAFVLSF